MKPRIGELFAGYGGLGMGVQAVFGGEVAWFSEFDPAPSKILAHHWPTVPNHGDITKIDWTEVEPVDILTGGFPCQDVSLAGARAGLRDGTRSGLWSEFARAIEALRPRLVVIENVRGLLSASAGGPVESDPWGVGDGATGSVVNALGAVLGDLADLGYDAEWCGVRAADAGAPHGRFRVFIVAHRRSDGFDGNAQLDGGSIRSELEASQRAHAHGRTSAAAENADLAVGGERWQSAPDDTESGRSWADASRRSGAPTTNAGRNEPERRGEVRNLGGTPHSDEGTSWERERIWNAASDRGSATIAWGAYAPAIRRWEAVTERVAPSPTNPDGRDNSHRLSARFVEWMQGLPAGHVTNPAIGLTRTEQLKALGNGVVPQQATLALSLLLNRQQVAA